MTYKSIQADSTPDEELPATANTMTFATLRALHAVIGAAIDDVERVYQERSPGIPMEFPSLDEPYYHTAQHTPEEELAEALKSDPAVVTATVRIVAACAQLSTTVNKPWSGLMEELLWVRIAGPFFGDICSSRSDVL